MRSDRVFGFEAVILKQGAVDMKRFALLFLIVLAVAAPAFAQYPDGLTGDISVYADDQGNSCDVLAPGGGGLVTYYIVHKFSDGGSATGARFKATFPAGLSFVTFSTTFVPIGNLATDLSLGYGTCNSTTISLGSILCISAAPSPACSYISIAAADNFSDPITTDCLFGEYKVEVGQAIVNNDGSCPCNIATQSSTWGKVKSLYR
jgi:hypothetical protein